jgi:hypothetical protein
VSVSFDEISQEWLIRFLEHRIGDKRIIRQVQKWLKAGVLEDGIVSVSASGTGQGAVISPLLANIYLHYALDLWADRWRRRKATGDMIIVRYADDFIVGFQHEADARRFWDDMRKRFEEFSLSLNPDKTRLIEFGRFAAERRAQRGLAKPETFNFLGFTFICERNSRGQFLVKRMARSHAGDAQGDQGGTATANAPPNPGARGLDQAGGQRLLRLPCGANQRRCATSILLLCEAHLAAHPASAQSEGSLLVAADAQPGRRLDSSTANPSSVS